MSRPNIPPKGPNVGRPEILRRPDTTRIDYRGLTQDQNVRQNVGGIFNLAPVIIGSTQTGQLILPPGVTEVVTNNATALMITGATNQIAGTFVPNFYMQFFMNKQAVSDILYFPPGALGTAGFQYAPVGANTALSIAGFAAMGNCRFDLNFDQLRFTNPNAAATQTLTGYFLTGNASVQPFAGQTAF